MPSEEIKLIPDQMEDITIDWFSTILGKQVIPSTFKLTPNANAGTGFLSTLIRVEFSTEDNKLHQVVVKLLPREDDKIIGETRELVLQDNYDQTEIMMYKTLIPALVREIPDLGQYFCDVLFADIREQDPVAGTPYSSVLVLEDLKPEGYVMVHFGEDFKPEYFTQGLDFIVKLHSASLSLEQKLGTSLISAYPWFPRWYIPIQPGENRPDPTLKTFFTAGFPDLYKILGRGDELAPRIYDALQHIEKNTTGVFRAVAKAGQGFPCLVHADLWSHNFMIKEGGTKPFKTIDWQMMGYNDPTIDLANYTILCLPFDRITKEGILQAAADYYQKKVEMLNKLGLIMRRTWPEFELFFKTYGLAYGFIWLVMSSTTLIRKIEYEPKYRKIFNVLVEIGVVDFVASLV